MGTFRFRIVLCLLLTAAGVCASAQETTTAVPASWHLTRFSLGLNTYSGDTSSIALSSKLNSEAVKDLRQSVIDFEADFARGGGRTFVDREWLDWVLRNRFASHRHTYALLHSWIEHNQTAGIKFRGTVGPGVGLYLIDRDRENFMIEGGVAVSREVQTQNSTFPLVFFDPQLVLKVTPQSVLQSYIETRANLKDHNDVRIYAETNLNTQITQRIGIQIGYRIDFDNQPVVRHKKTIVQTYTMMTLVLGGRPPR